MSCNERKKNPTFNHESILSQRSVQNFNKIDAWVFEKSCPPTLKIQFWEKRVSKRRHIGIRMGGNSKISPKILLRLTWNFGKIFLTCCTIIKKIMKKIDFSKFQNPCNPLRNIYLFLWKMYPHNAEYCKNMSEIFPIFHCNWNIVSKFLSIIAKYFIAPLQF